MSTFSRLSSSALVAAGVAAVELAGFAASDPPGGAIIIITDGCFEESKPTNSFHFFQRGCNSRAAGIRTGKDRTTTARGTTNSFNTSALTANKMGILARNSVAMAAITDLTRPNLAVVPVLSRSVSMLFVNGAGQDNVEAAGKKIDMVFDVVIKSMKCEFRG